MLPCKMWASVLFCAALLAIAGCGSSKNCSIIGLNITPQSATVDHTATPPANSQTFSASDLFSGSGCVGIATAALINSNWTVSDPSVHLSASPNGQVTATCTAAVASPVTVKATSASDSSLTGQATLVCK